MADVISINAAKRYAILLTLRWGDNNVARYTNWTDDILRGTNLYTSIPKMEIKLSPQHGGAVESNPVTVLMPQVAPFVDLIKNTAFPRVFVDIQEEDPEVEDSKQVLFSGTVYKTIKNPSGKTGLIEVECYGARAMLSVSLSVIANATCVHTFCDPDCGKDPEPLKEEGVISIINNRLITVTGLTTTATNGWWKDGWALVDGLHLMIVKYTTGNQMTLKHIAPDSWLGATATFLPGCTKHLDGANGCRFWDREESYLAPGVKMPAYHPMIDVK